MNRRRIAGLLTQFTQLFSAHNDGGITTMDNVTGQTVKCMHDTAEIVGIPHYYTTAELAAAPFAAFGFDTAGWYVFLRIAAPFGTTVGAGFAVNCTDGAYIAPANGDAALLYGQRLAAADQTHTVAVTWATGSAKTYYIHARDLAIRNIDYRATYYIYDLSPYCTYTYALTADAAFVATTTYYTRTGSEGDYTYTEATVTTGEAVTANTYYTRTLTISGFTRNVTYTYDTEINCPITIVMPSVPAGGHYGAWFEFQVRLKSNYSITLTPNVVAQASTPQTPSAGYNVVTCHYHALAELWNVNISYFNAAT